MCKNSETPRSYETPRSSDIQKWINGIAVIGLLNLKSHYSRKDNFE